MRRKILNSICAVLTAAACTVPVWAEPMTAAQAAEALASIHPDYAYASPAGLMIEIPEDSRKYLGKILNDNFINEVFRSEDSNTIGTLNGTKNDNGTITWNVSYETLSELSYKDDYVKTWCSQTVPLLAPSGTDRMTALRSIYDWMVATYPYGYDVVEEGRAGDYQNAYETIMTGKAICASYSKLFRSMVETLPLYSQTGLVDWETGTDHIKVATVECYSDIDGSGHQWAAIQEADGSWRYFDHVYGTDGFNLTVQEKQAQLNQMYPSDGFIIENLRWNY